MQEYPKFSPYQIEKYAPSNPLVSFNVKRITFIALHKYSLHYTQTHSPVFLRGTTDCYTYRTVYVVLLAWQR